MNELTTTSNKPFSMAPRNLSEAMEFAKMISQSNFCPSSMQGKPADILMALQMGAEIGLNPMQAIQNICVINGKPALWGDALLAVAINSPNYVSHEEWVEGSIEEKNLTAFCKVIRKNSPEHISKFSMDDAKTAQLWGKRGPWSQYPSRMLQMRARAFALRDKFGDALRGMQSAEEVRDYQVDTKPHVNLPYQVQEVQPVEPLDQEVLKQHLEDIQACDSEENLKATFVAITKEKAVRADREALEMIIAAKDAKKVELDNKSTNEFIEALDSEESDNG